MSPDDVSGYEMNEPYDFGDEAAESLLSGTGRSIDPQLADLLGDMHVAFTSTPPAVGAELAALIGPPAPVVVPIGRFQRMRSSMTAKIAAGVAAAIAATGGLAVAGALPAPVQHAIDHISGDDNAPHHDHGVVDDETTTTVEGETTTTVEDNGNENENENENHGDDVSDAAHDHEGEGCEHGHDVSAVASDGRSNNPCTANPTSPTTVEDHGHDGNDQGHNDGHEGDNTPTTVENTPPTVDQGHDGSNDHGGGAQSGGDHGGSNDASGGGNGGGD